MSGLGEPHLPQHTAGCLLYFLLSILRELLFLIFKIIFFARPFVFAAVVYACVCLLPNTTNIGGGSGGGGGLADQKERTPPSICHDEMQIALPAVWTQE